MYLRRVVMLLFTKISQRRHDGSLPIEIRIRVFIYLYQIERKVPDIVILEILEYFLKVQLI